MTTETIAPTFAGALSRAARVFFDWSNDGGDKADEYNGARAELLSYLIGEGAHIPGYFIIDEVERISELFYDQDIDELVDRLRTSALAYANRGRSDASADYA